MVKIGVDLDGVNPIGVLLACKSDGDTVILEIIDAMTKRLIFVKLDIDMLSKALDEIACIN